MSPSTHRPYGEVFRERRLALGLTQQQVADRMGIRQASVAEFEAKRDHEARVSTLERYANSVGTTAAELFGGDQ